MPLGVESLVGCEVTLLDLDDSIASTASATLPGSMADQPSFATGCLSTDTVFFSPRRRLSLAAARAFSNASTSASASESLSTVVTILPKSPRTDDIVEARSGL